MGDWLIKIENTKVYFRDNFIIWINLLYIKGYNLVELITH